MPLKNLHITLIPIIFFGYAVLVNMMLLVPNASAPKPLVWDHSLSHSLDQLYADQQLHAPFAQAAIGALRYALLREGREGVRVAPEGWLLSEEEFRSPLPEKAARGLRQQIVDFAQHIQAQGGQVIVVLLPTKAESLGFTLSPDLAQQKYRLVAALGASGVAYLDAAPALEGQNSFFKTDTHWTPKGTRSVADLMARSFPSLTGNADVQVTEPTPDHFTGDLIFFVTHARLAPFIGLPRETAKVFRATITVGESKDLFAEPRGAHALVGTSYSANPRWGFEDALKVALARDILNFSATGQGPLMPMKAYLERQDRDPQATVIWEFPVRYLTDPNILERVQ